MMHILIMALDLGGTFVFAISGAATAAKHRLDIFGVMVLSFAAGNAGGIAPASNDASSGDYTPSEGKTAPTTPGGNPSNTQGVPTFSSAAQPLDANLPRTVFPIPANEGTAGSAGKHRQKPQ